MKKVSYSNLRFVSRKGSHYDTVFRAVVTETVTKGFFFKKVTSRDVYIARSVAGFFCFEETGEFTCHEIDKLVRAHNLTCGKDERLEY